MKSKISPELLQKIKDSVPITQVIGEHVVLKKSGANFTGLCPFHSERSPSFSVNEQKGLYHCYGCKKGGDLIGFVMDLNGLSFLEAVEDLAERARIQLPKDWGGSGGGTPEEEMRRAAAREKQNLYYKLNRFVVNFYQQALAQSPQIQRYLNQRGVSDEQIRSFYVGTAPGGWDGLTQYLVNKKAPLEVAKELGLIRPSSKNAPEGGLGYFDLFRSRAMFPIMDIRGKIVGFGGRALPDSEADGPKYMNSPESPIFHKSKVAYGLFHAQKHIREKDELILVEGYFDVIALHAAGFQNVVATCGTSLTLDHLNLFRRFASKITVLFDGDQAGISATERAMELGLTQGLVLHGAAMPEGLDPDELLFDQVTGSPIANGKVQMEQILEASVPLLDARISEQIAKAGQGPEARTQAVKQISQWLTEYKDPVGREVYLQDAQSKLGIPRRFLDPSRASPPAQGKSSPGSTRVTASSGPVPVNFQTRRPTQATARFSAADRVLLQAVARGGRFLSEFREVGQKLPPGMTVAELFDYPPARAFLTPLLVQGALPEGFILSPSLATNPEIDSQIQRILMEVWVSPASQEGLRASIGDKEFESELRGAIHRGMTRIWARFSHGIRAALQDAEAKKDAELHARLSKEYLDVQRKMKEFISFYDEA